jgi:hypothetical protein
MLQTTITLLIGLLASAYLLRRWWPTWRQLWRPAAASAISARQACHTDQGVNAPPASACGQGCGQCAGGGATPTRDHRVHIVRPHTDPA